MINYFAFGARGFLTAGTFTAATLGAFSALGFAGALGFATLGALAGVASTTGVAITASMPTGIGATGSTTGAVTSTLYGASTGAGVAGPKPNNALIFFNIIMSPYEFIYITKYHYV